MADFYTWTNTNSMERRTIERFLSLASDRAQAFPQHMTFKPEEGQLVIGWLRSLLNKLPSEMVVKP